MPSIFTIKKPKYFGARAHIIAAQKVIGLNGPKRERAIRRAIGDEHTGRTVHILRNGAHRLIITDDDLPPDLEIPYEGKAILKFVHEDGSAVFAFVSENEPGNT